jgi:hypothetical protein
VKRHASSPSLLSFLHLDCMPSPPDQQEHKAFHPPGFPLFPLPPPLFLLQCSTVHSKLNFLSGVCSPLLSSRRVSLLFHSDHYNAATALVFQFHSSRSPASRSSFSRHLSRAPPFPSLISVARLCQLNPILIVYRIRGLIQYLIKLGSD